MTYLKIRINPFKSELKKQEWMSNNCDICTVIKCYPKKQIKKSTLAIQTANKIGFEKSMPGKCKLLNLSRNKINQQKPYDKFQKNSF